MEFSLQSIPPDSTDNDLALIRAILNPSPPSLDKMAATLADDNFKCIFLNENDRIPIRFSLKCVPRSPIDNKPAMVRVMAWHQAIIWSIDGSFTDAYMCHLASMN